MLWLPSLAPRLFVSTCGFATSPAEVWMMFMGGVNTSLGAGVLEWQAIKLVRRIPDWLPPIAEPALAEVPNSEALPEPI
jgi:hypothetical protein